MRIKNVDFWNRDCQRNSPMWAREQYNISSPRFLAECRKRRLNQGSFVSLYFVLIAVLNCICFVYFPVQFRFSVSVKWLAVKTSYRLCHAGCQTLLQLQSDWETSHICVSDERRACVVVSRRTSFNTLTSELQVTKLWHLTFDLWTVPSFLASVICHLTQ